MVSIIIPTLNHLEDFLVPCLDSVLRCSSLSHIEIIIVAQVTEKRKEYERILFEFTQRAKITVLWYDHPLGYPKAINEGLMIAKGDYIVLLDNDTVLLDNTWLTTLLKPFFRDTKIGITSVSKFGWDIGFEAPSFWCVCIKKKVFDDIGLLDEVFSPGIGEDCDFYMRAAKAGYLFEVVPAGFPIWHRGRGTLTDDSSVRNKDILATRYATFIHLKSQDEYIYNEIFVYNLYNVKREDIKNKIVIDLGANKGFFTLLCREYGAKKIVAVEAHPRIFEELAKNVTCMDNITILNKAITDKPNETVTISYEGGKSTLYDPSNPLTDLVGTQTIQNLLSTIQIEDDMVLKVDIEGAEYDVLLDVGTNLLRKFKTLYIELHTDLHPVHKGFDLINNHILSLGFELVNKEPLLIFWDDENGERKTTLSNQWVCKYIRKDTQ
jgi:FkbM family methyltransferase